ncbi:MAG: hypothetical protein K0S07_1484 [Chlamydiales bacterium]|jgi:hypothetical protein|nr:hypothetical protein [Chlamydiales bacterium]
MLNIASTIKNIYQSEDLTGEAFVRPLKQSLSFFGRKISHASLPGKCGWIATAVIPTIALSLLALLGMAIKPFSIGSIRRHNQEVQQQIDAECQSLAAAGKFSDDIEYSGQYDVKRFKEKFINKERAQHLLEKKTPLFGEIIEKRTSKFQKVYLEVCNNQYLMGKYAGKAGAWFYLKLTDRFTGRK